jgi:hypothetical protein
MLVVHPRVWIEYRQRIGQADIHLRMLGQTGGGDPFPAVAWCRTPLGQTGIAYLGVSARVLVSVSCEIGEG